MATFIVLGSFTDQGVRTIKESPKRATATLLGLAIASLGNIRTETLTAFSAEEFGKILGKMT